MTDDTWFSYLKHLDIPGKLKISSNIVDLMVKSDIAHVESAEKLDYDDILDHQELNQDQKDLEEVMKKLSTKESKFLIGQTEYENKEARFIELTYYTQQLLDQKYAEQELILKDIDQEAIETAINQRDISQMIEELKVATVIISRDVDVFYKRRKLLTTLWKEVSEGLVEMINNFEFRGLKVVSSNLRVKLKPKLAEFKEALKDTTLGKESISRIMIETEVMNMVDDAREDLYGDLTQPQIDLLNEINPNLSSSELMRIISDDNVRKDLLVLLDTNKIDIKMKKVIDRLI